MKTTQLPDPHYVTIDYAAQRYGLTSKTIRRRISDGKLPAYRIGRNIRLLASDVEALAVRIPTAQ